MTRIPFLVVSARRAALIALALSLVACRAERAEEAHEAHEAPRVGIEFGTVMADVARRYELLGKAGVGGRYELASYELGELEELFEEVLPHAGLPKEGHPEAIAPLLGPFRERAIPELERAIASRDRATFAAAFARTSEACNGCHQASGHGFVEVPSEPGRVVPNVDPIEGAR